MHESRACRLTKSAWWLNRHRPAYVLRLLDMQLLTSSSSPLPSYNHKILKTDSPISISMKLASSGRARGSTPGSLKLVLSNIAMTNKKRTTAKTGIAAERWTARYGHLQGSKHKHCDLVSFPMWFELIQFIHRFDVGTCWRIKIWPQMHWTHNRKPSRLNNSAKVNRGNVYCLSYKIK